MDETDSQLTETRLALSKELLDILVCPVCKTPVNLLADGTGVRCGTCELVYPVRDDIPVMLPEEAKKSRDSFHQDLKS